MKKIFKGLALSLLAGISFAVHALPETAPVCNEAAIATYKQEIIKNERANTFVRAAVYVCAASALVYGGYKFFHPAAVPDVTVLARLETLEKKAGITAEAGVKAAGVVAGTAAATSNSAAAKTKGSFFSGTWIKGFCIGVRDMLFQSAAVAGLTEVGKTVFQYAFYDNSMHSFLVRATSLGRTVGDIDGYAGMLTTPGYGEAQLIPIKDILKTRCTDLCSDVERVVAYMRYREDSADSRSKAALVVAENYLVNRSNSALASLWSSVNKEKVEDVANGMMLALQLLQVDIQQACTRFDCAYRAA